MARKRFFDIVDSVADFLSKVTLWVVIVLTSLMVLTVIIGVLFRYVLLNPLNWSEELARYLMIWAALLAVSVCIRTKEHVSLTIVVQRLPIGLARVVNFLISVIAIVFLYVLTDKGFEMAFKARNQLSMGLGISMFWPLLSVPVAGTLAVIQQVFQVIISFKKDVTIEELVGKTEVEEALEAITQSSQERMESL